ncbi:PAS domain S-box protein [Lichenicoccus roseus]|nr:PAS domain S-box protein [Lichenicoccus roseus]
MARGAYRSDDASWSGELDFHALAETLPTLIFVTDAAGRCLYTNRRFQDFTGQGAPALLGDRWLDVVHPDDRVRTMQNWSVSVATAEPYESEYRFRSADGDHRWFLVRGAAVREQGRIVRWVGNCSDIDDSKQAQTNSRVQHAQVAAALSASEARFRTIFHSMFNFAGLLCLDGTLLEVNDAALAFGGLQGSEVIGRKFWDTPWWDVGQAERDRLRDAVASAAAGSFIHYEARVRSADGRIAVIDFSITPVRADDGRVVELIPEGRDLTEAKRAEQHLRRSEQRLRSAFEAAAIGMARIDLHTARWIEVNDTLCAMLGYGRDELMALACTAISEPVQYDPGSLARMAEGRLAHFRTEKRYRHKAGQTVWAALTVTLVRDAAGEPDFALAIIEDITEQRRQAVMLAEADERRSFLLALADRLRPLGDPVAVMATAAEMLGRHLRVAQVGYSEIDAAQMHAVIDRDWNDGRLASVAGTLRLDDYGPRIIADLKRGATLAIADVRADGRTNAPEVAAAFDRIGVRALLDVPLVKQGRLLAVLFVHHCDQRTWTRAEHQLVEEVCERTWAAAGQARAEAAAAASGARFRSIIDAIPQMVWSARPDGSHDFYNRRWYEFTGMRDGATEGAGWNGMFHPDDQARAWAHWRDCLLTGATFEIEYRLRHHGGAYRWVLGRALPIREDDEFGPSGPGKIVRWIGTCTDLQGVIEAREALAAGRRELERRIADSTDELRRLNAKLLIEMERRERVQAALVNSQKLEALGQLTAGISHDFNNVIAAISGAFSVIERRCDDPRIREITAHGVKAAWRGAALVRQMLMFAHQQVLEPRTIRLCMLFEEVEPLLRRSVGEGVVLTIACAADLPSVRVDPVQLETALINLVVNANDAMQGSGRLAITAARCPVDQVLRPAELQDCDAVTIELADDGPGIPPDVLQRVTEPFFTTKGAGKGTGLGLAMVHGFLRQSGGALRIAGQVGTGTRIMLHLPSAAGEAEGVAMKPDDRVAPDQRLHGGARLLLVEDDDAVRGVLAAQLADLGYVVIEAADGDAAVQLAEAGPPFDAAIVDVIMPGMDGRSLAEIIRRSRPSLPVLFMTGHADRARLASETVIEKPFAPAQLADRMLDVLGRRRPLASLNKEGLGLQRLDQEGLDRLDRRLRSDALRPLFRHWRAACAGNRLPGFAAFDVATGDTARTLVLLKVDLTQLPMTFKVEKMPAQFARLSLKTLEGMDVAVTGDEALGSREAAYRRCVRLCRPSYEYARFDLGEGRPVVFERLLLPFSDDGVIVDRLVAMVVVDGMPTELGE